METALERLRRWDNDSHAQFESWSAPHRELYVRADKDAYDIAKLIIQSLLFIHAGALVIIPTSQTLREVGIADNRLLALLVILSFGVITTIVAAICVFFALSYRSECHWKLTEAYEYRSRSRVMSDESVLTRDARYDDLAKSNDRQATGLEEEAATFNRNYIRFRTGGIIAVLLSTILIITASVVAACGLMNPHRSPTEHSPELQNSTPSQQQQP